MTYKGGRNIAMKLPLRVYHQTLAFYRDTLDLPVLEEGPNGAIIDFGPIRLNLDKVPNQSQTDIWLQVTTDDTTAARSLLADRVCDEVEALPDAFNGFWIAAPSGTIHLIDGDANG